MTPYLTHHLLWQNQTADKTALLQGETTVSYASFRTKVAALARILQIAGLARGDRCAIYLPKIIDECWSIFAVSAAQGVFVPVNTLLKGPQVKHIIADCGAKILLTTREKFASIEPELGDIKTCKVLFVEEFDLELDGARPGDSQLGEDLAAILYTSGSTGRPKGVMLSHRNLIAGTRIVANYLNIQASDRLASVLPFSFDYGLNQLLTSVAQNASIALVTFRFGEDIVRAVRAYEITGLAGVPTVWALLLASAPSLKKSPPASLRYITNSGGPVPKVTVEQLQNRLPETEIFLMYGLTEAFRSTYLPPAEIATKPGSIGIAIPECEILVLKENGEIAKPGETGILIHRGPTVSMGYWQRPEATAEVIRPNPFKQADTGVDMVCYSGDRVRIDEDGYLYFVGRNDAMIKTSGYRVSQSEVEDALMMTGAFASISVVGLPDDVLGQRLHAVGTPAAGIDVDTRAILKDLARTLPPYMIPKEIELVERLPQTPNGKVNLRQLVAERV